MVQKARTAATTSDLPGELSDLSRGSCIKTTFQPGGVWVLHYTIKGNLTFGHIPNLQPESAGRAKV